jgi:hypothetical protein
MAAGVIVSTLSRVLQIYLVFDHIKYRMIWYDALIIYGHRPSSLLLSFSSRMEGGLVS